MPVDPALERAILGRQSDLHLHLVAPELSLKPREKTFETGSARGRDKIGARLKASRRLLERRPPRRAQPVDLVPDLDNGLAAPLLNAELGEHPLDVGPLSLALRVRNVADMDNEVRLRHLLEGGMKGRHQIMGQIGDEPHRVRQDGRAPTRQGDRPHGWVKRRKKLVTGAHRSTCQAIEERRFAGIGIADERNEGVGNTASSSAMKRAGALDALKLAPHAGDTLGDHTPVGLDLGLARPTEETKAAALALEVGPGAHKAALLMHEMGELDLQASLAGLGAGAEYLEDEAGAVEDLGLPAPLEIALLNGREGMVDDNERNPLGKEDARKLSNLARAEKGSRAWSRHTDGARKTDIEIDSPRKPQRLLEARLGAALIVGSWLCRPPARNRCPPARPARPAQSVRPAPLARPGPHHRHQNGGAHGRRRSSVRNHAVAGPLTPEPTASDGARLTVLGS